MNEGVYPGGICLAQFQKLGDMSELRGNVRVNSVLNIFLKVGA